MDKQRIIQDIEALFPIDSDFPGTNKTGEQALIEAIKRHNWRDLPENILSEYRELCIAVDNHHYQTWVGTYGK